MTSGPRDVPGTDESSPAVYHIELRQFPHNLLRFNLAEGELRATIVEPWAREQWIELGDRKWNPHQAKLTVLEGPHLPVEELSLGRGWRAARRQGRDVTERLLAAAREAMGVEMHKPIAPAREARPPAAAEEEEGLLADSLGLELLTLLGAGPAPPRRAWELAQMRHPERTASQCLALAERAVASLLRSRLVVLTWADRPDAARSQLGEEEEVQALLHALDSWTGESVGLARR